MKKFHMPYRLCGEIAAICILAGFGGAASAQELDIGNIADNLRNQVSSVSVLITILSFVIGVYFAISALMRLKAYSENPRDPSNNISGAIVMILAAAAFVALPSTLGMGISSLFGDSAPVTNATTGFTTLN